MNFKIYIVMGMNTNKLPSLRPHGNNRECGAQEVNIIVPRDLSILYTQ